ncbi:DUF932 domain-containing protein [Streptomyces sp. NPDC051320]|uniref:DUF932 domain-containing protein n=1 Tax=Streptomyces sp. NPDC051320 TaxID=3154644 RepID=UPI00341739AD
MSTDVNTQFHNERTALMQAMGTTRRDDGTHTATVGYDRGEVIGKDGLDTTLGSAALYTTTPAWHGLGNVIPGGISDVDDVIALAGLGFDVERVPALYRWGEELRQHDGRFHTVRSDTGASLGVVGAKYRPIQNREGFGFLQELVRDSGVIWESAGALRGGRKVFISIRLPKNVTVDADGIADEVIPFIAVINSHDGHSPFQCVTTPWRPICANTERFAVRDAYTRWVVRHTASATQRVMEARRTLKLSVSYYDKWAAEETALARTDMALDDFHKVIADLWPVDDDAKDRTKNVAAKRVEHLDAIFATETQRVGRTAYAAERAVTDYLDHIAPRRPGKTMTEELARATALLEGTDDETKSRAHQRLMLIRR